MKASRLATLAAAAALLLSFGSMPVAAQAAAPEGVESIKPIVAAPAARKTSRARAKTSTAKNEARVYLFRGLLNIFSMGMDELADKIKASGIPATVYNHTEWEEVAGKIAADYKNGNHAPIVLIGHSLGADAVIFMAEALGKRGVPVALVVPFDGTQTLVAPANVARVMNITQRDYAYARRGAGFRGELQNIDVSSQGVDHLNIDKSPRLHAMVLNKIIAVVKKGAVPAEFAVMPGEAKEREKERDKEHAKPAPKPETASLPADAAKPHETTKSHEAAGPEKTAAKPVENAIEEKKSVEKPAAETPKPVATEAAVRPVEAPKPEEKPAAATPAAMPATSAAVTPSAPSASTPPVSVPAAAAPQAASAPAAKPVARPATERLEYEKLPGQ